MLNLDVILTDFRLNGVIKVHIPPEADLLDPDLEIAVEEAEGLRAEMEVVEAAGEEEEEVVVVVMEVDRKEGVVHV
ncbi:hypothetical protein V866_002978 [Kwoniella sp. B9012]